MDINTTTLTQLDGLFREALAQGDRSAADHYDRLIGQKIVKMYDTGELDSYASDDDYSFMEY